MPVLLREVLDMLRPADGGIYVDGTVGGGGHASAILLASSPRGRLVGIDRDPAAIAAARAHLASYGDRVTLIHGELGNIAAITRSLSLQPVSGLLLDLGLSSPQVDHADRGFSFSRAGPLDMRMDPTDGESAHDLLRRLDAAELADILRDYGEERYSRRIAAHIKEAVRAGRLATTVDLANVVEQAIPVPERRRARIHPATRTFQALRIAVNRELEQLEQFLADFPALLAPGGRCAIISFHSLEDRLVKQRFRDLAWTSGLPPKLAEAAGERVHPVCHVVTKRPIFASDEEVEANPRARSARLRACERAAA